MTDQCPHCKKSLDIYAKWSGRDYDSYFRLECDHCDKPIQVTVHQIPDFEIKKAEVKDISRPYCAACQEKLSQLSAHNEKQFKT